MTSQGALRAGAGLVEVFVPEEIYEIVAERGVHGSNGEARRVVS